MSRQVDGLPFTTATSQRQEISNEEKYPMNGLEDAISNVQCAMQIGREAIEASLSSAPRGRDSEAAAYALYNLEREIDRLAALLVTKPCRAA